MSTIAGAGLPALSFAVVVPMYNEETGAERCVAEICQQLGRMPHRCRMIAVDDGSADRTAAILQRLAGEQPLLHAVTHQQNRGYGAALRSGVMAAQQAGFTYVLFMDSDLTNSPADIPHFVKKMAEGLDVIKATRYRGGGGMVGVPWQRRCVSTMGAKIAGVMFRLPISDCTNGFRAVKTGLLMAMNLKETGFPIIVEELYHCVFLARGFGEVPVTLANRAGDRRPTSFPYRPGTFYRYLKYCVLAYFRIRPGAH